MRNIKFHLVLENKNKLDRADEQIVANSVEIKDTNPIFIKAALYLIILIIFISTIWGFIESILNITIVTILWGIVFFLVGFFLHEFIHAIFYRTNGMKNIYLFYRDEQITAGIMYTTDALDKMKWIIGVVMPFIVALFFFILSIILSTFNLQSSFLLIVYLVSFIHNIGGINDCITALDVYTQAPKYSFIFNDLDKTYYTQ